MAQRKIGEVVQIRMTPEQLESIDARRKPGESRAAAVRRLIDVDEVVSADPLPPKLKTKSVAKPRADVSTSLSECRHPVGMRIAGTCTVCMKAVGKP